MTHEEPTEQGADHDEADEASSDGTDDTARGHAVLSARVS